MTLARRAPDFFDWISHRVACPREPPPYAVEGLRRAADAAGVVWRGPGALEALALAFPGAQTATVRSPERWLRILDGRDRLAAADRVVATGLGQPHLVRRVVWAAEETGRRVVLVDPASVPGGFPVVDGRHVSLEDGAAVGSALVAALVGLEPDAVALAARCGDAVSLEELAADDPALHLVTVAQRAGVTELADGRSLRATTLWQRVHGVPVAKPDAGSEAPVELARRLLAEAHGDPSALLPIRARLAQTARDAGTPGPLRAEAALLIAELYESVGELALTARYCFLGLRHTKEPELVGGLATVGSRAYLELGEYDRAVRLAGRAWRVRSGSGPGAGLTEAYVTFADALRVTDDAKTLELLDRVFLAQNPALAAGAHRVARRRRGTSIDARVAELVGHVRRLYDTARAAHGDKRLTTIETGLLAGRALLDAGDLQAARDVLQDVEDAGRELLAEGHPLATGLLQALGRLSAAEGDPERALVLFRRAICIVEERLGGAPHRLEDLHRDCARALADLGRLDEARAALERAIALKLRVSGPDSVGVGVLEHELAALLERQGHRDAAIAQYDRALQTLDRAGHRRGSRFLTASRARHHLLHTAGRLEEALAESDRALAVAPSEGADPSVRATVLVERGETLRAMGRHTEARTYYQEALRTLRAQGTERAGDIARVLVALGTTWLAEGDTASARASLHEAIAAEESAPAPDQRTLQTARRLLEQIVPG